MTRPRAATVLLTLSTLAIAGGLGATSGTATGGRGTAGNPAVSSGVGARGGAGVQENDEFRWTGVVAAGRIVEIYNLNGPLSAEPASGSSVEIVAIKKGDEYDRRRIDIQVVEHADGVTVCALYEDNEDNVCAPGDEAEIGGTRRNRASVTFTVRVPSGVRFHGNTMNGAIRAEGLDADAELMTMNGAIDVSTRGWASAKTMNGAIHASFGATDWSGRIELESMNGAVTVTLPAAAATEISARTMNGRVHSDFDLDSSGWRRNRAEGTIGGGGRSLSLSTMNGAVRIRRTS